MSSKYNITGLLLVSFLFLHAQTGEDLMQKGNEYYKLGQFDLAERQYRAVLDQNGANTDARYNLANALYQQRKYKEAVEVLNQITQEPATAPGLKSSSYYNEGVVYTKQKDLLKSIEAYKGALRLNPDDKEARENLQKALLELRQQQQQQQKDQKQNKNQSRMSQKEAERQLQRLQEKEQKVQERLQGKGQQGNSMPKDW